MTFKRILIGFLLLGMLSGASTFPSLAEAAPTPRCSVFASAPWVRGPTPRLRLEAFSDGPTCAKAVAVLAVRDSTGKVLFSDTYVTEFLAITSDARTMPQMLAALGNWVNSGRTRFDNSTLPNWLAGADKPVDQEFPFTPDENITRADYLAIKTARAPVLCFVQGMESLNCLVYRNGGLEPFGIQSFPG